MRTILICLLSLLVLACGGSPPGAACTPGVTMACVCPTGGAGVQECNAAGSGFSSCACIAPDAAVRDAAAPADAAVETCDMTPGTFAVTATLDASRTTSASCLVPGGTVVASDLVSLIEQVLIGTECPAGCSCEQTEPTLPNCDAAASFTCDGTSGTVTAQRITETAAFGSATTTSVDGLVCAIDFTVTMEH